MLLSPHAVVGAGALGLEGVGRGWPWGRGQRLRRGGDFNGWWGAGVLGLEGIYLNLAANAPSVRAGIRPRVFSSSKTYINNKTVNLKWHGYCLCDKK